MQVPPLTLSVYILKFKIIKLRIYCKNEIKKKTTLDSCIKSK